MKIQIQKYSKTIKIEYLEQSNKWILQYFTDIYFPYYLVFPNG